MANAMLCQAVVVTSRRSSSECEKQCARTTFHRGLFTATGPDINPAKFRTRREAKECKGIPPVSTKIAPINCCGAICHGFC